MRTLLSRFGRGALASSLCGMLFSPAAMQGQNSLPQLWPTFSEPSSIINVGLSGQSGDDFMAITTFEGAYNQQQLSSRLYVNTPSDATYWLAHALPSSVTVTNLSYSSSDPDGTLKALLSTYGPQGTNTVSKYVICDPVNMPESCNMAATLAGINDAMVVNPDNLTLMSTYGMTEVTNGDLRTYLWIGSNQDLIANGTTYGTTNMVSNPSGGSGTTGWSDNSGTLTTGTGSGTCGGQGTTLEWTRTSGSGDAWAWYDPAIPAGRITTAPITPYVFSVQVCVASGSPVYLDVWNGAQDITSSSVSSGSGWQTLQLEVPLPIAAASGNTTIKLQVRTAGSSTQVFFENAATVDNRVAIDYYQYKNLLSSVNNTILAQCDSTNYNLRDYEIAAKMLVFELTDDGAYTDEQKLYGLILNTTSAVTPVLGYIDHEAEDVQFMSASYGKFLNATDDYNNGSVWASFPQPASLPQALPTAFKTSNGTLYLAFASSDGDNVSVDEHQSSTRWTASSFMGAVPTGWTISPAMTQFAPGLISNYFTFLPQSSEMIAGPSGFGYTRNIAGSDQSTFASDTASFMNKLDMSTTEYWTYSDTSSDQSNTFSFASDLGEPHVMWGTCLTGSNCKAFNKEGSTYVDDQFSQYNASADFEVAALENCLAGSSCAEYSSGSPNYLEALIDDFTLSPDDELFIAQQLSLHESYPIVLMTPSMLEAAEAGGGSATSSPQAVLGTTLTSAFPQNLLFNAQGQSGNYGLNSGPFAYNSGCTDGYMIGTIYEGTGATEMYVPASQTCYAWEYLNSGPGGKVSGDGTFQTGRYYRFTASVFGASGVTAEMTVYDGSANNHATLAMNGTWQTITMIVKINSTTAGQIQIGPAESSSAQTLYFNIGASQPYGWYYSDPASQTEAEAAGGATYNNGYFNAQAGYFSIPASQSNSQWIAWFPGDTPVGAGSSYTAALAASTSYTATVDVAGTSGQQAYLDLWNGSTDSTSSTATLGTQWQTLSTTFTTGTSASPTQFEVRLPSGNSAAETVYFRNASLVPTASVPSYGFQTGLETGQTQLTWSNTVDSTSPGGGETDVSSALTEESSTITHGGGYAIQYSGTASGGSSTHSYLEAFNNSTSLSSNSRLSYWIYPMTPMGSESGASSMTGLNSTCAAIDIIFTNGTALRNDTTITDQYGNQIHPAHQCDHLQPDQWNYVTANLGSLSGLQVERIDVGYDQPSASGNYGGYIDDITLSH
jgi:GxGYxYP putative glycoside hydrolase C-terminal domain/GxGYxY sequence motif in domain of unknown function N-terminal